MATNASYFTFDNTSDATFRSWVAAFHTAMLAVGWNVSGDTGQIDTTTVTKPTTSSQTKGFKMYTPNDGGTTFYLKVDFGSNGFGALGIAIFITVGWETDGAGTFTGNKKSGLYEVRITSGNAAANATVMTRFCYLDGAFSLTINEAIDGTNIYNPVILIDRYRNGASGAALNTGVSMFLVSNNSTNTLVRNGTSPVGARAWQETVPAVTGVFGGFGPSLIHTGIRQVTSWSNRREMGVGGFIPWDARTLSETIAGITFSPADNCVGAEFEVEIYGVMRTYRCFTTGPDSTTTAWVAALVG